MKTQEFLRLEQYPQTIDIERIYSLEPLTSGDKMTEIRNLHVVHLLSAFIKDELLFGFKAPTAVHSSSWGLSIIINPLAECLWLLLSSSGTDPTVWTAWTAGTSEKQKPGVSGLNSDSNNTCDFMGIQSKETHKEVSPLQGNIKEHGLNM